MNTFDLCDLTDSPEVPKATAAEAPSEIETWAEKIADKACSHPDSEPAFYDIETGPRPEEEIRPFYHEKTFDEFEAGCDKRWKPETVEAKYVEYTVTGWGDFMEKAALSPVTGRVLVIGMLHKGQPLFIDGPDEAKNLQEFWVVVEDFLSKKTPLIGHNSNSFDLPFLVRRSWLLGVPVPREVRQGRYWNPLFRDTMEQWSFGAREYAKLDVLGQYFSVGQKTEGVAGKDFHKLWFGTMDVHKWGTPEEQRAKALEYSGQDVKLTAAIAAKMWMV